MRIRGDSSKRLGTGVKNCQMVCQLLHHGYRHLLRFQKKAEHALVRQTAHDESIFGGFAPAAQPPAAIIEADRHYAQIDGRSEASVQTQFFLEEMPPLGQSRKIEKSESHGFFDFVDRLACQEDVRDVSFFMGDLTGRLRVKLRPHHRRNQCLLRIAIVGYRFPSLSAFHGNAYA